MNRYQYISLKSSTTVELSKKPEDGLFRLSSGKRGVLASLVVSFLLLFTSAAIGQTTTNLTLFYGETTLLEGHSGGLNDWTVDPVSYNTCLEGDTQTKTFNTTCSSVGNFTVTAPHSSSNNTRIWNITVLPTITFNPTRTEFCEDGDPFVIDGGTGSPDGGAWYFSGEGVVSNTFYPLSVGTGTYQIEARYTVTTAQGDFSNTTTVTFEVLDSPNISLLDFKDNQCQNEPAYTITAYNNTLGANANGGQFFGAGITDHGNGTATFNPSSAGLGTHTITYNYTDPNSCYYSTTRSTRVGTEISINDLPSTFCLNEPSVVFTYSEPDGSVGGSGVTDNGAGTATFNPITAGAGVHTVTYTYNDGECDNIVTQTVQVFSLPNVNFSGISNNQEFCRGHNDITLTGNRAPSGFFTGDAILDHGNGTATLELSNLSAGSYSVTYQFTSADGCTSSITKVFVVNPLPLVFSVSGGGSHCPAEPEGVQIKLSSSENTFAYQLYRNAATIADTKTGDGGEISFEKQTNAGNYTVIATNPTTGCTRQMNSSATISILPEVAITKQPESATICEDGSVTFSVEVTGINPIYQWFVGGVDLGVDNNVLIVNNVSLDKNNSEVYCIVSSDCGDPIESNRVRLYVEPKTRITSHPLSANICSGQGTTLSVTAVGKNRTYQWFKDNNSLGAGATESTYSITNLLSADAGTYYCVVTGDCGNPVKSNDAELFIDDPIVITAQPTSKTACEESNINFTTSATGTSLTYQWWFKEEGETNFVVVPGPEGTLANLGLNSIDINDVGEYYCEISSPCGATETTNTVTLTIPDATVINSFPSDDIVVCENSNVNITVDADAHNPTYSWYKVGSATPLTNDGIYSGTNGSTLTISSITSAQAGRYYVLVSGTCGSDQSNEVRVVVKERVTTKLASPSSTSICSGDNATFSLAIDGDYSNVVWQVKDGATFVDAPAPNSNLTYTTSIAGIYRGKIETLGCGIFYSNEVELLVKQPISITPLENKSVCDGTANITFSVEPTANITSYVWEENNVVIPGANGPSYTLPLATSAHNGNSYRVTASNGCDVIQSSSTLTVLEGITITAPPQNQTICDGGSVELSVTHTPLTPTPTYEWFKDNLSQGNNNSVFTATEAGTYKVSITNSCGTVTSQEAIITVDNDFTITKQPTPKTVCEGSAVTFTVETSNSDVSYQWRKDGVNIAGATSPTLTLNSVTSADAAQYSCLVFNSCKSESSSSALLTVASNTVNFSKHPTDKVKCIGDNFVLTTEATTPSGSLTYTWYKEGEAAPVSTGQSLAFNNFQASNAGTYYSIVTNGCTTEPTNKAEVSEGEAANPIDLDDITRCVGQDANFVVEYNPDFTYQWFMDGNPLTDSDRIIGSNTHSLSIEGITKADQNTYSCEVTGTCGEPSTVSAFLTVKSAPIITANPSSRTICSGTESVQFSVSVAGDNPETYTYQWQYREVETVSWGGLPGGIANDNRKLTINNPDAGTHNGFYRCVVLSDCGNTNSTAARLQVEPTVIVTPPPAIETSKTVCEGNNTTFTVDVTGPVDMQLQWYKNGVALTNTARINGVNLETLSINNITVDDAGDYTCQITSSCGNTSTTIYTLTVQEQIVITQQPKGGYYCPGSSMGVTVVAKGTVQYQWQEWDGTDWQNITGASSSTYTATSEGNYRCQLTNICQEIYTDAVEVLEAVLTTASTITVNPANPICEGQNISLTVDAEGTGHSIQWYKGGTALTDGTRIGGSQTKTLTINNPIPSDNGIYQAEVNGLCGSTINISETLSIQEKIKIYGPASTSVLVGEDVSLSITTTGTVTGYQWYHMPESATTWNELAGETNPTLTITNASHSDAGSYKCAVYGDLCSDTESKSATLTVLTERLIETHPETPKTVCEGNSFTLSVTTHNPVDSYQWFRNDDPIAGANSPSLTINPANLGHTGAYTCLVAKDGIEDRSSASIVTVNPTTQITVGPTGGTKCEGNMHVFSVVAKGTNLTYKWFKDDVEIDGEINAELILSSLNIGDSGTYRCEVTGDCGATQQASASLAVSQKMVVNNYDPIITGSNPACEGETITLEFDVTGDNITFEWLKDGLPITDANISGRNTNKLQISNAVSTNIGNYSCVATGTCGNNTSSVVSNATNVEVNTTTAITTNPISRTKCEGDNVSFTVQAKGHILADGYTWYFKELGSAVGVEATTLSNISITNNTANNTSTLTISAIIKAEHEGSFWVEVDGSCNPDAGQPVRSNTAELTINGWIDFTDPNPVISTNPVCEGGSTTITIDAVGDGRSYLWKRNGETIPDTDTGISGRTSSQLEISSAQLSYGGVYTCTVFGPCGAEITSNEALLVVNPIVTIVSQSTGTFTRCEGGEVVFTVEATGTNPTFAWKKGGASGTNINDLPLTSATLSVTSPSPNISRLRITGITTDEAGSYTSIVEANCGSGTSTATSSSIILNVNSGVSITKQPNDPEPIVTICQNSGTELAVEAEGTITSYRWMRNGEYLENNEFYSGVNTSILSITSAETILSGYYSCEIAGSCNTNAVISANVEMVVNPTPQITLQPAHSSILCEDQSIQLVASATGVEPLQYTWWFIAEGSGTSIDLTNLPADTELVNISGADSPVLSISTIKPKNEGAYYLEVVGGETYSCGTTISNTASVTVNPSISITSNPTSSRVCEGTTATFTVNATGTGELAYQWIYNNSVVINNNGTYTGANSNQLTVSSASKEHEGQYTCIITSSCNEVETYPVTLSVTTNTTITANPLDQTVLVGNSASFNVAASGSHNPLTYQWQKYNDATNSYEDVPGAESTTYIIGTVSIDDAGRYRCAVTGDCGVKYSNPALLTVNQPVSITDHPQDLPPLCVGDVANFSVTATGTVLNYQWQFRGTGVWETLTDGNGISGANSSHLTIASTTTDNNGLYRCVVTGPTSSVTTNSNTATLIVNDAVTITNEPGSQSKCSGDNLVLEVEAIGIGLDYIWHKNNAPLTDDGRITGTETNRLVIYNITSDDAGDYHCVVTNSCDSKESNVAIISINPTVKVTIPADESLIKERCVGQTVTFSVESNVANVSYQWHKGNTPIGNGTQPNGATTVSGANSPNLTISSLQLEDAGNYYCRVTDGCTSANSTYAKLKLRSETLIELEPQDIAVCEGNAAFFEVKATATGTDLTYSWYKDNSATPLENIDGKITGVNGNVLSISNVSADDAGSYHCVITGGCSIESTSPAELSVNELPVTAGAITGSISVCQGATNVHYTVPQIAHATTYVWELPYGATIASGTGTNSIQVNFSNISTSGSITVHGVNGCGIGAESEPLPITVNPTPYAYAGSNQRECSSTFTLEANEAIGGVWSIITGDAVFEPGHKDIHNPTITDVLSGTNTFRWTVTQNGCTAFDEVTITNLQVDVDAGDDQTICSTEVLLEAVAPIEGASWRVVPNQGQGAIEDPYSPTTIVTNLSQGVNVFEWRVNNDNCISSDRVYVTNNRPLPPYAGQDDAVASDEYTLQASAPEDGTIGSWEIISGGGTFDNANNPETTIRNLMPGANILQWTVSRGSCSLSDQVIIENIMLEPADAGEDQTLCINYTSLNAKAPIVGVGEWTVISGGGVFDDRNNPNTRVTNLAQGENVLRWTVRISAEGVSYDEVTIINHMPTIANAGADRALCTNEVQLSANAAAYGTSTWTRISGSATIADINDPTTQVTNLSPGVNEFKWTIDNNGCVSTDFVIISNDTPTVANAGEDQTICTSSTELLPNSPTFGTGSWSIESGSGFFEGNIVSNLGPDDNVFVYTITNGQCKSIDKVTITNHKPTTPNAGYDLNICVDNVVLDANPVLQGVGSWSRISGSGDIADIMNPKTGVTNLSYGMNIFRWTIEKEGCSEFDEVIVSNNYIEAFAGSDETLCESTYQLMAANPEPGIGTWSILEASSASFDDRNAPNAVVTNLSKGSNKFRWTVDNKGCIATADVTITNSMPTTALAGEDQSVCAKEANLFANAPSYGKGVWSAMSGSAYFDDPEDPKTRIRNLVEGDNVLRWTITEGICSSFDDVLITRNLPEEVFAGNDQVVCSNEVTLAASPASIGTGRWEIVSGQGAGVFEDRYKHNTKVTNLGQGDNVFRWTVSSGDCHISDEVIIRSSIPSTAFAGADQTLCSDNTMLNANSANDEIETGSWQLISGSAEFENPNSPTSRAINIRRGENVIAWVIDRDGCQSISELKLINNSPSQPIINSVGDNNQICADSVTLFAQNPAIGTGYWSTPSNDAVILNPEQNQTKVINLKFGTNTFRWTTTHMNCSLFSDIIVTNNLMYVNAGKDTTVNDPTVQLIGNVPNPGTGYWETVAANPETEIETPDNFSTFVHHLGAGANVFRWNIDYKGCIASDEITVNYIVWPEVDFEASTYSGCPPLEIRFTNKTIGQGAPYTWVLGDDSSPVVQQQVAPLAHTYHTPGVYKVTLTATAPGTNNTVTEEKTITIHPSPTASFEIAPEVVYIPGQTVSGYNYSRNIVTSIWDFGDGKDLVEAFAPIYEYSDTGKFNITLRVINQYDCEDTHTIFDAVHVVKRSRFFFPDAFTPNPYGGSGGTYSVTDRSNNVFYPILADGEILDYELKVFNRAGVMVFLSNDINIGWDGYYKGKLLPQGVYVYYITGKYNNGEPFREVGNVLLIAKEY